MEGVRPPSRPVDPSRISGKSESDSRTGCESASLYRSSTLSAKWAGCWGTAGSPCGGVGELPLRGRKKAGAGTLPGPVRRVLRGQRRGSCGGAGTSAGAGCASRGRPSRLATSAGKNRRYSFGARRWLPVTGCYRQSELNHGRARSWTASSPPPPPRPLLRRVGPTTRIKPRLNRRWALSPGHSGHSQPSTSPVTAAQRPLVALDLASHRGTTVDLCDLCTANNEADCSCFQPEQLDAHRKSQHAQHPGCPSLEERICVSREIENERRGVGARPTSRSSACSRCWSSSARRPSRAWCASRRSWSSSSNGVTSVCREMAGARPADRRNQPTFAAFKAVITAFARIVCPASASRSIASSCLRSSCFQVVGSKPWRASTSRRRPPARSARIRA